MILFSRGSLLTFLLAAVACNGSEAPEPTADAGTRLCQVGEELDRRGRCRCVADEACPEGKICEDGKCQRGCHRDEQCSEGEICEGLTCIGGCRSDEHCGEGRICKDDNSCANGCRTDEHCPAGQHCTASNQCRNACANHSVCAGDEFCDPDSGRCLPGCRTADQCGGPASCDDGICNCTEMAAFTALEIRDGNDSPGVSAGDVVSITLEIPHQREGDEVILVALVLDLVNLENSGHESASLNNLEFASNWGRWSGKPAVLLNLNGSGASMNFSARLGQADSPGLIRAELASYDPDVDGPCRQVLANTRSYAVLGANGAASLSQETCIDLIWTRSVHLLPGQASHATAELSRGVEREDLQLGGATPALARDSKVCLRGTNGLPLPVAGDWRGESPIAVDGRLVVEGLRPWDTGQCDRRADCGDGETCVSGRCRERFIKGSSAGEEELRDRDESDALVQDVTPASCLSDCAPPPLNAATPAWGPGDLDLADFLPRTRDTELRLTVISGGESAGWSDLYLLPQDPPDWYAARSCVCSADGSIDCAEGSAGSAISSCR